MNLKNNIFKHSKRNQKGASIFAVIFLLVIVGMVLLSALKVVPAYLNNNIIANAMEGMINNNDFEAVSLAEVRSGLQSSLVTNGIRDFASSNVVLTREGDDRYIDINYETRAPLFYNIEVVVIFENRFDKN
ncbi:MAG: DUF4845 domain-containing protein [Gammaproteobacteria bacterium]|jgi:hypothetical protein|nr:DUF4845 domain-containing protein [Gammaproteobacteria bacterium]